ncbi:MAG: tail fiber domain-containing protein [Flavobacteriaceae bacterium]
MKAHHFITSILLMLFTLSISAQNGFNYKAVIKDNNGNVISNSSVTVQFTILQGVAQTNVYRETHTPTTDANGIIIINIGEGTPVSGVFANIDWGADNHFINTQINTSGGLLDMGTTQFKTVPYALNAGNAATKIDELSDGRSFSNGSSIYLGVDAGLNDNGSDNANVGVGFNALKSNISGIGNIAIGFQSLYQNTGYNNTATGVETLFLNTTGYWNNAYGTQALFSNSMGNNNTAIGVEVLYNNSTGSFNTAIGNSAGVKNETGNGNIFLGYQSGYYETGSDKLYIENSFADADNALIYGEFDTDILRTNSEFQIGNPSLTGYSFPISDGSNNQLLITDGAGGLSWINSISLGSQKIDDLSDGKSDGSSVFLGENAGLVDDGNNLNTAFGVDALHNNLDGSRNIANGKSTLRFNVSGSNNVAIGYQSLYANNSGNDNIANGYHALLANFSGSNNIAIGSNALNSNKASENVAVGYFALYDNTSGIENTAIGTYSLQNNDGRRNTAVGFNSLNLNTSGEFNTAVGAAALENNNADYNTAVGRSALRVNTTGTRNTATGYAALEFSTGNNNTAFGRSALSSVTTGSNNTAIGYNAQVPLATSSNQVRVGNTNVTYAGIQIAWTVTSDRRWKDQIRELPYGLDFVKQLKPVDYIRKNNNLKTREIGFIAQDIEVLLNKISYQDQGLLSKDDEGNLSLRYNDFIPLLTKAMQEQQEIIENLKAEVEEQKSEIDGLTATLEPLQNRLFKIEQLLLKQEQLAKTAN